MKTKLFTTLEYIGAKLNEADITWAVGASIVLNHFGLIDNPRDIDLFVVLEDIDKAYEILCSIGEKIPQKSSDTYSTEHFHQYRIKGADVDLMAGFKINHDDGIYEYRFGSGSINSTMNLNGIHIPLTSLEDWYILYQLIPERDEKVRLIEDYLLERESIKLELMTKASNKNLPEEVRERVQGLYKRTYYKVLDEIKGLCTTNYSKEVEALYLGGSVARGDFIPLRSDIDLYVVLRKPSEDTERSFEQAIKQIENHYLHGVYRFNPHPISLAFTTVQEIKEGKSFLGSGFEYENFIRDGKLIFGLDVKGLISKSTREEEIIEANNYLRSVEQCYKDIHGQCTANYFSYIFRTLCVSLSSKGLYVSSKEKAVNTLYELFPGEKSLIKCISKAYELYLVWGSNDLLSEEVALLEDIYYETMPLLLEFGLKAQEG